MKLSERARNLRQSEPRRIYDAAQKYRDVIDLTLGDPDLPPPENVRDAACRAIAAGRTRYSANAGLMELRRAIAAEAEREYGLAFDPETEVSSITEFFPYAFLYENEMRELFGVKIQMTKPDYQNKLYRIRQETPFFKKAEENA